MVPVWSSLFTVLGALGGVWLTHGWTARRDQVRWAQERQQREFDTTKAALVDTMTALGKWHAELHALTLFVTGVGVRKPDLDSFADFDMQVRTGVAVIDLQCSLEARQATNEAFRVVSSLDWVATRTPGAVNSQDKPNAHQRETLNRAMEIAAGPMTNLLGVYKDELARLAAEPVVLPQKPRKRLTYFFRRKITKSPSVRSRDVNESNSQP